MVEMFNTFVKKQSLNPGDFLVFFNLANSPSTIENLAAKLGLSDRTIQRSLKRLITLKLVIKNSLTDVWQISAGSRTKMSNTDKQTSYSKLSVDNQEDLLDNLVPGTPGGEDQAAPEASQEPVGDAEKELAINQMVKDAAARLQAHRSGDASFLAATVLEIVGQDDVIPELFTAAVDHTTTQVKSRTEGLKPVENAPAFFLGVLRNLYKNHRSVAAIERSESSTVDNTIDTLEPSEAVLEAKELIKRELRGWGIAILPRGWDNRVAKVIENSQAECISPADFTDALTDKVLAGSMTYWASRLANRPGRYLIEMLNEYLVRRQDPRRWDSANTLRYRRLANSVAG